MDKEKEIFIVQDTNIEKRKTGGEIGDIYTKNKLVIKSF